MDTSLYIFILFLFHLNSHYMSVPSDQFNIGTLEAVARHFTRQISGMTGLDYWDRLKQLQMLSQERRRERYMIILLWKIIMGFVEGYNITFQ